ncbi:glyoxalase [Chryseotalea sanaruensis]|uniref:Glyoxalase n=1 Tax=Chryseotalea sanaruensis TaxID=2482724 RepID=A0A401UD79_9BACT|nr:VOC family protein [Chryseotalea sanaruensis]GCC52846.1 glyoxalase [Chryseotalea sanaruensis]
METKKHVLGIGGLFFRSKDPKALSEWYRIHFGINDATSNSLWITEEGPTVFSPFKQDTDYFGSKEQMFMINFRVQDLDGLMEKLAEAGVRIDDKRMNEAYGKFAWVYDSEGNKLELWEAV